MLDEPDPGIVVMKNSWITVMPRGFEKEAVLFAGLLMILIVVNQMKNSGGIGMVLYRPCGLLNLKYHTRATLCPAW